MTRVYKFDAGYNCTAVCTVTGERKARTWSHDGGEPAETARAEVRVLDAEGMDVTTFFTSDFAEAFGAKALELDAERES